jgi:peroxygenase
VTQDSWIPFFSNPLFYIYANRIDRCKHGSDSETYDRQGEFIPEKFENIFKKYDTQNKGGLDRNDIFRLVYQNRDVWDPVGWTFAAFEWGVLYFLCAGRNGLVTKEDVRAQFDVSLIVFCYLFYIYIINIYTYGLYYIYIVINY